MSILAQIVQHNTRISYNMYLIILFVISTYNIMWSRCVYKGMRLKIMLLNNKCARYDIIYQYEYRKIQFISIEN